MCSKVFFKAIKKKKFFFYKLIGFLCFPDTQAPKSLVKYCCLEGMFSFTQIKKSFVVYRVSSSLGWTAACKRSPS